MLYGGGTILIVLSIILTTLGITGVTKKSEKSSREIAHYMSIPWQDVTRNRVTPPRTSYAINVVELSLGVGCFLGFIALIGTFVH